MSAAAWLAQARERADAATAGPWEGVVDDHGRGRVDASVWADAIGYYITEKISSGTAHTADAEFIAHARSDVPALVAALEAALKLAAEWAGKVRELHAADRGMAVAYDDCADRLRSAISAELPGESRPRLRETE